MKKNALGFTGIAAGLVILVLLLLGTLIPVCALADGQNPVVFSDNLNLTDVVCKFNAGADEWNEDSLGMLEINGNVTGPANVAAIRIASWQNDQPTAEEAKDSAEGMVAVWKKSASSIQGEQVPFEFGNGRPVYSKDSGMTQYIILTGLDTNLNLVGYAVIEAVIPDLSNLSGQPVSNNDVPVQDANGQGLVVLSGNLNLSNVTWEFEAGSDGLNEGSIGYLSISGDATGPASVAAVWIASWQGWMPTADEAKKMVERIVPVWKEEDVSFHGQTSPFRFGNGRPVFEDESGTTQYTILAGIDMNQDLVGYAVVSTDIPKAADSSGEVSGFTGLQLDADGVWRFYAGGAFEPVTGIVPHEQNYYYVVNGVLAAEANGLTLVDGNWFVLSGGRVLNDYNGLYFDQNLGWWLIQGGVINFDYTGLYCDSNNGWWLVRDGAVDFNYSGLWNDPVYGWWLVSGGTIAWDYTGLYGDPNYGWWLIGGGTVCFDYNGVWDDPNYGPWNISNGAPTGPVQALNGLNCDADGVWRLYDNGTFVSGYTGLYCDANVGWWLIRNGEIAWDYTGLWNDPNYGWWLIGSGTVCFNYNGLWNDPVCGWWLISGGTINWGYTGTVEEFGGTWNIVNGQLIF